jgi:hypothetical protein
MARDLIHEHQFERECKQLASIPMVDDALHYVTYQIARYPDCGIHITGTNIWAVPFRGLGRRLVLFYRFDGQPNTALHLLSLRDFDA